MINTALSFNDKDDYMEVVVSIRDTNSSFKHDIRLKLDEWQIITIKDAIDNFLARSIANESERSN